MKKILLYTFRTFPRIGELSELNTELFVFGKLKEDLPKFLEMLKNLQPDIIIGIAKSTSNISRFETKAVNIFNKTKKVSKDGREYYSLNYPSGGYGNIKVNNSYTDSFCNWTMYKIAENTKVKHQFVHMAKSGMKDFIEYLSVGQGIPPARSE